MWWRVSTSPTTPSLVTLRSHLQAHHDQGVPSPWAQAVEVGHSQLGLESGYRSVRLGPDVVRTGLGERVWKSERKRNMHTDTPSPQAPSLRRSSATCMTQNLAPQTACMCLSHPHLGKDSVPATTWHAMEFKIIPEVTGELLNLGIGQEVIVVPQLPVLAL